MIIPVRSRCNAEHSNEMEFFYLQLLQVAGIFLFY